MSAPRKPPSDGLEPLDKSELALLAELAEQRESSMDAEARARASALLAERAGVRAELAAHRELVSELRALPAPSEEPDWRALEASLVRACAEVPVPPRSWLSRALGWSPSWRWPALALGAAAAAALALVLVRGQARPGSLALGGGAQAYDARPADAAEPDAVTAVAVTGAAGDEDELAQLDEDDLRELVAEVPSAAAITLGLGEEDATGMSGDGDDAQEDSTDELLPDGELGAELERLDGEALRALDQWLDAPRQKG